MSDLFVSVLNISGLCVYIIINLLCENRKPIPKCLRGKNIFMNINLQNFSFIPSRLTNKNIFIYDAKANVPFFILF